ncbi:glycosyltransferase family 4 protein [Altericista sp. CCNU0014]|uniref:glycosyltransferase family 4 protein n=1 Tax=Altericista sp. CCNU0014 TaxID=3082949 RepID=UPI00384D8659
MTSKKKLLYLAVCDPDLPVTGVTVRMGAFVKYLARDYDITLLHMAGSGHAVDPDIEARYCDRRNRLGVSRRIRVPFSQLGYFLFSPSLYRQADRLLASEDFDYLLLDYGLAAVYGLLLAKRHQIPIVYCSSNIEYRMYWEMGQRDPRRLVLTPYVYWAERGICQQASLVTTVSERDRQVYAQWLPGDRILAIPQGFEPESVNPFYDPPPPSPPIVLFVGSFKDRNNVRAARTIVRDIAPKVARAYPDVKFQFVGASPPSDLQAPNIELAGFVDDLHPYWQRANLVIAPMPFAHGISTKVVSGLAFGKTVLTTPQIAAAMPRTYPHLHAVPLETFPERIVELLAAGQSLNTAEFKTLCQDFAWPDLMARLRGNIEKYC